MRNATVMFLVLVGLAGCGAAPSTPAVSSGRKLDVNVTPPPKVPAVPDKTAHREKDMPDKIARSEEEWKKSLTPEQYYVLREKGTERPFVNEFDDHFEPGAYACAACGQELFNSKTKFHSGCGWPAFYAAQAGDRVQLNRDVSHGMVRTEVTCARCGSHLGHIFDDAPQTPSGQRYCINSVSLKFVPAGGREAK